MGGQSVAAEAGEAELRATVETVFFFTSNVNIA
jgi:hypothetical protein